MASNCENSSLLALLAGVGVGALVAILFAPRSGEETREWIVDEVRERKDLLAIAVDEVKDQADAIVHTAKKKFEDAVESGKEAYRREINRRHIEGQAV